MSKLFRFFLALVVWANFTSPLSSQGPGGQPPPAGSANPAQQPANPDPKRVPQGKNHVVQVGDSSAAKVFIPPTIQAKFDRDRLACSPTVKENERPRWTLQVLVDTPIWYYCAPHCGLVSGMVGAINPPTTGENTFEKFMERAKSAGGKTKALKAGEQPPDKSGEKTPGDTGGKGDLKGKSGGASATLQRGQPKSANDLAAVGGGTASVDGSIKSSFSFCFSKELEA
ncbi:hypothetical protein VP01_1247g2 [Puccinia sorghi]|uniref:Blue (type 1) copper domain-containing protein n=1 Tax=Puccinia sorghi TaxID=27349 RepID=A0A0L6VR04_9BASI|nr:hypothetical protein VP01_1247g2 [Puccinia sorghi]